MTPTGEDEVYARWVEAFAQAWRAPVDGDSLADEFDAWLQPDYTFSQPLARRPGVGVEQFRQQFARPLLQLLSDVHGTVESWAGRENTLLIEVVINAKIGRRPVRLRACDRVVLVDGLAAERHTYADPLPIIVAIARTPRSWWPAIRAQRAARPKETS
ncbi:MAG: nuclear transport factor 2 family protein [Jatrophihabitans sp.]